jgi:hypothetical protein
MTPSERQALKARSVCMCVNCGQIGSDPTRPPDALGLCSDQCQEQLQSLLNALDPGDPDDRQAVEALMEFGAKWPDISAKKFKHLVAHSARMEAKHPEVWPFKIEASGDCWLYRRKDGGRKAGHVH